LKTILFAFLALCMFSGCNSTNPTFDANSGGNGAAKAVDATPAESGKKTGVDNSAPSSKTPRETLPGLVTKEDSIRHFISISGGNVMGKEMLKGLLNLHFLQMRRNHPELSDKVIDDMRAIFEEEADIDKLIDKFVPIYAKHYTQEEIEQMTAFFESPVGQKMAIQSRPVTMECFEASKEWGRDLKRKAMPQIKDRLRREGVMPKFNPELMAQ